MKKKNKLPYLFYFIFLCCVRGEWQLDIFRSNIQDDPKECAHTLVVKICWTFFLWFWSNTLLNVLIFKCIRALLFLANFLNNERYTFVIIFKIARSRCLCVVCNFCFLKLFWIREIHYIWKSSLKFLSPKSLFSSLIYPVFTATFIQILIV